VAEVHAQTRHGLVIATGFVFIAVVAGLAGLGGAGLGWWVPLHLFVVGGLLSAISATTLMLAVTWSSSPAPHPIAAAVQRVAVVVGALGLVVGRDRDWEWLFVVGAVMVVLAMIGLAALLMQVRQRAVTGRYTPAIDAYIAAVVAGTFGMSLGIVLGLGDAGEAVASFRQAHLILNMFGMVGLVIAGTLPFFSATQVRSKMSPRATPNTIRATVGVLALATLVASGGALADSQAVVAGGLIAYAVGLVAVATMLPIYGRGRLRWGGPRVVQLLSGLAWWAVMTLALAIAAVRGTDDTTLLRTLVIGGFAQILVASLAYLGPVLRGGGHQRLTAGFALTRSWVSLVAGNVAAVAALGGWGVLLGIAVIVWAADLAIRAAQLRTPT
jgi:nitrite reductase (NO-forming)